ncbi:hypothetical protein PSTT_02504 [Puccinia striiformis]|uniref:Uncharacterized protein n=1 Tax=Puccinia striiformis TaxID=27350 RepID=A0A2S4VZH1_9BASI|nr:hypothetical protein PSTT_02504 [Puccinia striiformis]
MPSSSPHQLSTVEGFVSGALGACVAVTFTNPMEVAKTRLQLDGELRTKGTPKAYTNTFDVLRKTARSEGLRACQKGLGAAVSLNQTLKPRLFFGVFMLIYFFPLFLKFCFGRENHSLNFFAPNHLSFDHDGLIATVYIPVCSKRISLRCKKHETDLRSFHFSILRLTNLRILRTVTTIDMFSFWTRADEGTTMVIGFSRSIIRSDWSDTRQPVIPSKGTFTGLLFSKGWFTDDQLNFQQASTQLSSPYPTCIQIGRRRTTSNLKAEGFKGLMRGVDAAMMRTAMGSSVQLPAYNYAKTNLAPYFSPDSFWLYIASSSFSGLCVLGAMQPADTALTRMYNQSHQPGKRLYKNPVDCLWKTVQIEGFTGLYKGSTAHFFRIAPHTIITLVANEAISQWCKLETKGVQRCRRDKKN